jgi:predicted nucleic acid-binding protein
MIAPCVIDASVAIKWVITEDGTDAANRLRGSVTSFHAPDLIVAETANILWKKIQRNELTREEAELACGILRLANIEIHAMGALALPALHLAAELRHPVYNATYLALAQALDVPMVTADRRLINKLAGLRNPAFPEVVLLG